MADALATCAGVWSLECNGTTEAEFTVWAEALRRSEQALSWQHTHSGLTRVTSPSRAAPPLAVRNSEGVTADRPSLRVEHPCPPSRSLHLPAPS